MRRNWFLSSLFERTHEPNFNLKAWQTCMRSILRPVLFEKKNAYLKQTIIGDMCTRLEKELNLYLVRIKLGFLMYRSFGFFFKEGILSSNFKLSWVIHTWFLRSYALQFLTIIRTQTNTQIKLTHYGVKIHSKAMFKNKSQH